MQPLSSCESSRSGGWGSKTVAHEMTYSSNSFNTQWPKLPCFQKHYSHSETGCILQTHFCKANHLKIFAELNINANLSLTTSAEQFPFSFFAVKRCCNKHVPGSEQQSQPSNTVLCNINQDRVDTNGASVAIRDGQHADRWGNTAQTAPCGHTNTLLSVSMQEMIMFYKGYGWSTHNTEIHRYE